MPGCREPEHGRKLVLRSRAGGNRSEAEGGSVSGEDRIERAADELRRLESEGDALDDILNGETGRRWIEEYCADDLELAKMAFELVHPGAWFLRRRRRALTDPS